MNPLDNIGLKYQTDKTSPYHNYTEVYWNLFKDLREKQFVFLELGIGDITSANREGESALMWKDFFRNAKINIVDNDIEKVSRNYNLDRIKSWHCDQTDALELIKIIDSIGNPLIIIDDASHIQSNTIKSFEILFPLLEKGGLYCIEDTVTSYWPAWEGSTELQSHWTIMGFMHYLTHLVNMKRQETFNPPMTIKLPSYIKDIESISFFHSQIIIKKK